MDEAFKQKLVDFFAEKHSHFDISNLDFDKILNHSPLRIGARCAGFEHNFELRWYAGYTCNICFHFIDGRCKKYGTTCAEYQYDLHEILGE